MQPFRLLHRLVARPRIYDAVQRIAGERLVREGITRHLQALEPVSQSMEAGSSRPVVRLKADPARLLDLGGGTGGVRSLVTTLRYVCLDADAAKLRGFRRRYPGGLAVAGDATRNPFLSGSADVVLCLKVAHHLDDRQLGSALEEAARVLRPGGTLILSDAVWCPSRWISRVLWAVDRGSHPRTEEQIRSALSRRYSIQVWERFSVGILHEFVTCVARLTQEPLPVRHDTRVPPSPPQPLHQQRVE